MEIKDIEMMSWSVTRHVGELIEYADECSAAVRWYREYEDRLDGVDLKLLEDFYRLADGLLDVWLDHPQGEPLRGELTPETFKAVLDSLSTDEQAGTTSVPALS